MTKKTGELIYTPHERQREAHQRAERYILYGGALGGGKTMWLCATAIQQSVLYPGNVGFLGRHRLKDMPSTLLETFDRMVPKSIVKSHHRTERYWDFVNGSRIYYDGLDDYDSVKERVGGLEIGWFGVDQAEEISESVFDLLTTRLRLQIPGLYYHGYLTANPSPGWLRDMFIDQKKDNCCFVPALPTDNPFLPGGYVEEMRERLPEAMVQQLLDGDWDIDAASDYLVPYSKIRKAIAVKLDAEGPVVAGLDISRYGDDETVYILRQGSKVLKVEHWGHQATTFTAGRVARNIREDRPIVTNIDSVGVGGGVYDQLEAEGLKVKAVNVGEKALDEEHFADKRAEYYDGLGKRFIREDIDIPDNPKLASQLSGMKYLYDSKQRLRIESKEKMRKRGLKSPDFADALMLAFIEPPAIASAKMRHW